MNLLLVVLWAFALPYPRFRPMASCLSTVWTCIIIVCKMLYQLKVVSPNEYSSNCTEVQLPGTAALSLASLLHLGHQGAPASTQGGEGRMQRDVLRARGFLEEVSFHLVYGGPTAHAKVSGLEKDPDSLTP